MSEIWDGDWAVTIRFAGLRKSHYLLAFILISSEKTVLSYFPPKDMVTQNGCLKPGKIS